MHKKMKMGQKLEWVDGHRTNIDRAISRERKYQDNKWGTISEHPHTPFEWIGIMEKELAEAKAAWFQRPSTEFMIVEVLQVIATGVAMLEQHGVVIDLDRYGIFYLPPQEASETNPAAGNLSG